MQRQAEKFDFDELMDDVATAAALGVSRQTLANWRSTKRHPLPYVKIGSLVRYRRHDVEQFIRRCTVEGAPQ